jgi:hypothetical protein
MHSQVKTNLNGLIDNTKQLAWSVDYKFRLIEFSRSCTRGNALFLSAGVAAE